MAYKPNFSNSHQPTMAELLAGEENYPDLRRGDIVEGQVMGIDENGISISVGYKSEGVIPLSELHSIYPLSPSDRFKIGETVNVLVLDTKGRNSQIILSFDKAKSIDERMDMTC